MLRYFPFLLLAGFVVEISSLIWVGSQVGVIFTLVLLIAGAFAGMSLIRNTGLGLNDAFQRARRDGGFTVVDAGDALLRMIAGVLLIVPGFASDILALLLLLPPVSRWITARAKSGAAWTPPANGSNGSARDTVIIDGEAVEIVEDHPRIKDQSRQSD